MSAVVTVNSAMGERIAGYPASSDAAGERIAADRQ